ncbi:MAG: ATP-binding cassette domain-containing protein [Fimbriimonadaceae bacterium]
MKAGEMIGLVGHSGAGKSTTINLVNGSMSLISDAS